MLSRTHGRRDNSSRACRALSTTVLLFTVLSLSLLGAFLNRGRGGAVDTDGSYWQQHISRKVLFALPTAAAMVSSPLLPELAKVSRHDSMLSAGICDRLYEAMRVDTALSQRKRTLLIALFDYWVILCKFIKLINQTFFLMQHIFMFILLLLLSLVKCQLCMCG